MSEGRRREPVLPFCLPWRGRPRSAAATAPAAGNRRAFILERAAMGGSPFDSRDQGRSPGCACRFPRPRL